jgi:hypothetical protein
MFLLDFPSEGVQPCRVWVFIFDNGKTNNTGKKQYLGTMNNATAFKSLRTGTIPCR